MYERFTGKIAIITGGANGIGKGIACRLGLEKATVLLLDNNKDALDKTVAEFCNQSIKVKGYPTDISNEKQVTETINSIAEEWKQVDVMVHAAGIVGATNAKITDYPTAEFDKLYEVNLKGAFLMTKYTLKEMVKHGTGRILLVASIAGKEGNPGMVGYSSTKAGVIGLVKGVAKEFATTQITVNGLAPAVIKTAMNKDTAPEQLRYMLSRIPMNRLGTVEEVAAMSCFIVSEENSFSTGFIYDISGGRATY